MSARPHFARAPVTALVLLGTGGVGGALLRLLATPAAAGLQLVGAADSTRQLAVPRGLVPARLRAQLAAAPTVRDDAALLGALDASGAPQRVVVDATASEAVAARHADWLAAGYHVVSANKAALGGALAAWQALRRATAHGATSYGDAATVGAGLPVLSTLRRLYACGDRLLALEGVFSGSLSWLFNRFDGSQPFSALLREARALGYTEPDPRLDLGGGDVARKLLILARSAGHTLDVADVVVDGLVPEALRAVDAATFLARADELDAGLEARRARAAQAGRVLRFLGRLDAQGSARVGLVELAAHHPAARLAGTDNLFALTTQRYRAQPLVIQGPGAGSEVTAQALLGDLLALRVRRASAA
ncbi:MAG: homoserine dehydrogenase [Rhodanobacteraceae bacterium]|jgi:aspartokinase/homoserine dehydrogenase 1|nr:homoserine dehydrogenase [Rhodanobacteraceae bacterium]